MKTKRSKATVAEAAVEAAEAHTNLTVFAGVVALLESGALTAPAFADSARIIAICEKAQQKQLKLYEKNLGQAVRNAKS